MESFSVKSTGRIQMIDITAEVRRAVTALRVTDGSAVVFVPHTTAAVTINENADPDVVADMVKTFNHIVPHDFNYAHGEGNSQAHMLSSLVGASETLIVKGGAPVLGTWQAVYFCEFDGPRTRTVHVEVR